MKFFSSLRKVKFWPLYLLLLAFFLIKMYRGVNGDDSSEGGIWNYFQILFIVAGFGFLLFNYHHKSRIVNLFLAVALWIMLVSLLNYDEKSFNSLASWFFFFMSLCAPMVMLISYCLGRENSVLDFSVLIKATYYVLIVMFYYSMTNFRVTSDFDAYIAFSDIYYPMCLLPLVLLQTKSKVSFIPFLALVLGIIVSGKRGGLIIVAIVATVYYLIGKNRRIGSRIGTIAMFVGIIVLTYLFIDFIDANFGINTLTRIMNASDDGGSGRFERWDKIMNTIGDSDVLSILVGHGFDSVYRLTGGRAHNDFLEVFYNYGLIAVILYGAFFVKLIMINIKQFKKKYPYAKYLTCSIVVALGLALVSYYYVEPTYVLSSVFVIGLLLGDWSKFVRNGYLSIT